MDSKLAIAKSEPIWNTNNRVISIIAGLIILLFTLPLFGMNSFYLHLFIMIFMHAVMAQSWNVIAGFSGQISLGHGAFFGIGAYTSSFFFVQYGISPWISIFIGMFFFLLLLCIIISAFSDNSIGNVSPIGDAVAIFPAIVPTFLI